MTESKSNLIYIVFLIYFIVFLLFFIIYPIQKAVREKQDNLSLDYNQTMVLNGYHVKVSNAMYITDTKQFVFTFAIAGSGDGSSYPEIDDVYVQIAKDSSNDYTSDSFSFADRNETSQYVFVSEFAEDFLYVEVTATSVTEGYDDPDSIDEFGEVTEGEHHDEVVSGQFCRIYKQDITFLTSDEAQKQLVYIGSESETDSETEENIDPKSYTVTTTEAVTTTTIAAEAESENETESIENDESNAENESQNDSEANSETADENVRVETNATVTEQNVNAQNEASGEAVTEQNTVAQQQEVQVQTQVQEQQEQVTTQATTTQAPVTTTTTTAKTTTTTAATTTKKATTTTKKTSKTTTTSASTVPTKISISNGDVTISVGKSVTLDAVIEPSGVDGNVTWSVNRSDIASVNSSGKVTGISSGKVIVTATTSNGLTASCMITVE